MPPRPVSSPFPRVWLALGGLVVVGALVWLASSLFRRETPRTLGTPSATAATNGPRGPALAVTSRPRATVSGRVLDEAGQAVAGAAVCAWVSRSSGLASADLRIPRCAPTDAAGAYSLADLLPATPLLLSATADRFPPAGFHGEGEDGAIRLADGEPRAGVDFVLRHGGVQVRGRVLDATGGVVGGALVVTDSFDEGGRAMATSDEKGDFTLWTAPGPVRLGATASGYAPGRASGPAPGHFFELYLLPGSTLVGRAVVAGGETPVVSALIEAIQVEGGGVRSSVRTDADGRFRVEGLPPGRFRVEATSEGREGYSHASVTLGMGETSAEVVVELDQAFVVAGKVVEKGTGAACAGGEVRLTDPKQNEFSQATIEPDGAVRMPSVIPGSYRVEVTCDGHVARDDYPVVVIVDRDAPPQRWEVDAGASMRVAVIDASGKSVSVASVTASPSSGDGANGGSAEHADKDGTFLVAGLKPGGYHVSVNTPDGNVGTAEATVDGRREERVRIELPLTGAIDGVVEDDDHKPIANVQVTAMGIHRASARSLDDGTFTLTGLPTGEYTVVANERAMRRVDAGQDASPPPRVTVTAPGHAKTRVVVAKRDGSISGRVVDASGQPVTDAFLDVARAGNGFPRFFGGGSGRPPVVTDTEGRFTIDGLADGDYNLRASRKGGGEANLERVKVGSRGLTMRLLEGASISGVLLARGGAVVDRFTLRARERKTSFDRSELFFHARGVFVLRDLPPGTYDLTADGAEGAASGEVTLAEGEQKAGVTLTVAARGVLRGQVVSQENGAPIAGARISVQGEGRLSPMGPESFRNNTSGADGRFALEGVLSGKWTLIVDPSGNDVASASVPIETSGDTDVGPVRLGRRDSARD